jgi:predicted outer membrane repeat protein
MGNPMNKAVFGLAGVVALLFCLFTLPAWPATVIVTSNADTGPNTLRAAIAGANSGDTIAFTLPGATITLASTLTLTKNVTIDGYGNTGLTISGNQAVGVLVVNPGVSTTIKNVTIADGAPGGIHNYGTLTVTGCTFSGNTHSSGGAIFNEGGALILTNSTLSANAVGSFGGGVYNATGAATITNSTFVGNSANYGGGVFSSSVASTTLKNNLFLDNSAGAYGGSADGDGIIADHNLYWHNGDSTGNPGIDCNGCASNTNAVNADPLLGSLGNNGGPTQTYLPGAASPALEAAAAAACPAVDQRGTARPQAPGGGCDIGAVQVSKLCYVNAAAAGANNGSSWTNAYTDLQSALNDVGCAQIWVAKGTYRPTATTDRSISFTVRRGVSLFGGFAGNENKINPRSAINSTALSGDIGAVDDTSDNSYHVVRLDGTTAAGTITLATNMIDGFAIVGGNANGAADIDRKGAGLLCDGSGSGHECSPWLNNLYIEYNNAADWAGGAFFYGDNAGKSSPLLTNSTIQGNGASYGGGLMCGGQYGGACNSVIANVTFSGNSATADGGGLYNAAFSNGTGPGTSSPTLINVTFNGNSAGNAGGAILSDGRAGGTSLPQLTNVILWGDTALGDPEFHAEFDSGGSAHATINTSIVQSGCPADATCPNVLIQADPLLGALGDHGGLTPTILPATTGSAFDSGDDVACASAPVNGLDQRGVVRPVSSHCDIGAVESDNLFANGFEPL